MIWHTIILLIATAVTHSADKEKHFAIVGNPLLHARPCKGNEDITIAYEVGLPPGSENQYNVHISEDLRAHSLVKVKFDSEASVTLSDPSTARISAYPDGFHIKYFKNAQNANFHVVGPATGVIPYITSIIINTIEVCENPDSGYLDGYVQGFQPSAEVHLSVPDQSCGRRKVQHTELITNGLPTKPGDWPWHAAIYRFEKDTIKYICGGTIITKNFILTAAHCATIRGVPVLPEILTVVLGKYNLVGGDIAAQEREVHEIIVHNEFKPKNLDNDIALLKLKTEATYDNYVQPICTWYTDVVKKLPSGNILGTVVGWGFDQTDTLSTQLKQTTIPKVSDTECIKSNPVFFGSVLNERKFCAGLNNGTSACNGDSGGGFVVFAPDTSGDTSPNATGAWYLRGIVSLSVSRRDIAYCDPYQFVVFTDVAKYTGWLKSQVKGL